MLRPSALGLVASLGLFLLGTTGPSSVEPAGEARVATTRPPDTIASTASTDTPVLVSLPARVQDAPVTQYTILNGPALSGVAGRSLTWITQGVDPGTYDIVLRATHPELSPDTLVVRVTLQ
ncbi:hypothetical protein BSZ35_04745 [Salinibacter sp. 10B]|uniref:hypothetical protein n=1 Tax=Salinibacter sp. 10B TaxID=1923971 RepID=UPI000CF3CCCA|nr:hypothetical protein [Salinibacter sp. 10B]PQJ34013.1 hypothetical protein BSZ35_04745 [Salinibacter sp. 10B]